MQADKFPLAVQILESCSPLGLLHAHKIETLLLEAHKYNRAAAALTEALLVTEFLEREGKAYNRAREGLLALLDAFALQCNIGNVREHLGAENAERIHEAGQHFSSWVGEGGPTVAPSVESRAPEGSLRLNDLAPRTRMLR